MTDEARSHSCGIKVWVFHGAQWYYIFCVYILQYSTMSDDQRQRISHAANTQCTYSHCQRRQSSMQASLWSEHTQISLWYPSLFALKSLLLFPDRNALDCLKLNCIVLAHLWQKKFVFIIKSTRQAISYNFQQLHFKCAKISRVFTLIDGGFIWHAKCWKNGKRGKSKIMQSSRAPFCDIVTKIDFHYGKVRWSLFLYFSSFLSE